MSGLGPATDPAPGRNDGRCGPGVISWIGRAGETVPYEADMIWECRLNRLGGIHGGKKKVPDDSGAITFSGTFSGTLVGVGSGVGAGAGV